MIHYNGDICDIDVVLFYEYNHTQNYKGMVENKFFNGLDNEKKIEYLAISYLSNFGNKGLARAGDYKWYFLDGNKSIEFDMAQIILDIIKEKG